MTHGRCQHPIQSPARWVPAAVLAASIALVWHSLGDHGLFPPDEGRYAAASGWMAEHGGWLAPELRGQIHVTKPPLAYWAQAASMVAFGKTEFAARFPSALATTGLLLATFVAARAWLGRLAATAAVALLACMPLVQVVGRLATTDAMLSLWWWCAICSAWMALRDSVRRPGWTAGFWTSCALVGLTKGPLLLAPPAIVGCWLLLAGRLRELRRLHPVAGLALAAAPLALVAWGYWSANPDRVLPIWKHEFIDRFTGGKHDSPFLTIPFAFVAGLFPATAMLVLPGFNLPWRHALAALRAGDLRSLLAVSVVLPLAGFSLLRGSSLTYVLPLAAPLAVLAGITVSRWIDGSIDDLPAGRRAPDVRLTLAAVLTILAVGLPAVAVTAVARGLAPSWAPGWDLAWLSLCFVPAAVASWCCIACWSRRSLRLPALAAVCAAWLGGWVVAHRAEDAAMGAMSMRRLVASLPPDRPVAMLGVVDLGIDWLLGRWTSWHWGGKPMTEWIKANPDGIVLVYEAELERMRERKDPIVGMIEPGEAFDAWPTKRIRVCTVVPR